MLIISHRGNLRGSSPSTENTIDAIQNVIELGFDCEIDVWYKDNKFWLGHDKPENKVTIDFFIKHSSYLWIHCKNIEALIHLKDKFNCFFHDKDTYTLTSKGYIWGNISSPMTKETIQVMPERAKHEYQECLGICTDFPIHYNDRFKVFKMK
jgi:glycerophosphoryl diester phosphodiesterase